FGKDEAHGFFEAQFANPSIFQALRNELIRALIFVPDAHIRVLSLRSVGDLLAGAPFFECGTYIEWRAFLRKHERKGSLPAPPPNYGEVFERGPFHQKNAIERVLGHELAGTLPALRAFLACDGRGFALTGFQPCDRRRQFLLRAFGRAPCSSYAGCYSDCRSDTARLEKLAP